MRRAVLSLLALSAIPGGRASSVAELPQLDRECPVCDHPFGLMVHACVGPSNATIASVSLVTV